MSTVRDLLFHLPRRYDDLRELHSLGELQWGVTPDGEVASARANVVSIEVQPTFRRRVQRTTAILRDGTGIAHAVWFGRRYIERRLAAGQDVVISGRVRHRNGVLQFEDPDFQVDDGSTLLHAGRIVPGLPPHGRTQCRAPAGGRARGARPRPRRVRGVPGAVRSEGGRAPRHRRGGRGGAFPGLVRVARWGAPATGVRRAPGRPGGHGRSPAGAWSQPGRVDPGGRRARSNGPGGDHGVARPEGGPAGRADRGPGHGDVGHPGRPRSHRTDAPPAPGRCRVGQDGRRRPRAGARGARGPAGCAARPDRPPRPAAPRHDRRPPGRPGTPRGAARRISECGPQARGPEQPQVGPGADRRRDARPAHGGRLLRRPGAGRHRRAAPLRRGAARPARGEGVRGRAARPAHDRDADPADRRTGPVRGPRRVRPANAAGRTDRDQDRREAPLPARGHVGQGPGRGGSRAADVRGRATHRPGRRGRHRATTRRRTWPAAPWPPNRRRNA